MRYLGEKKGMIKKEDYAHLDNKYDRDNAIIYKTVDFGGLKGKRIAVKSYGVWTVGMNLRKIAYEVFGDSTLWWTIGMVNAKPTDAHFSIGDEILYPLNPSLIKNSIG